MQKRGKSIAHLLLCCEFARALWNDLYGRVRLGWVMSSRFVDLFASWREFYDNIQIAAVWKMIPLCAVFGGKRMIEISKLQERTMEELRNYFFNALFLWTTVIDFNGRVFMIPCILFFIFLSVTILSISLVYLCCEFWFFNKTLDYF